MSKEVKVIITFIYDKVKGKDEQYYRSITFDEIYNSDENLNSDNFTVEGI